MVNEKATDDYLKKIAKLIDPDRTFLDECGKVVKWRKQIKDGGTK